MFCIRRLFIFLRAFPNKKVIITAWVYNRPMGYRERFFLCTKIAFGAHVQRFRCHCYTITKIKYNLNKTKFYYYLIVIFPFLPILPMAITPNKRKLRNQAHQAEGILIIIIFTTTVFLSFLLLQVSSKNESSKDESSKGESSKAKLVKVDTITKARSARKEKEAIIQKGNKGRKCV